MPKNEKMSLNGLSIEDVNLRFIEGKTNHQSTSNLKSVSRIISDNLFSYFNLILGMLAILMISIGSYENMFFVIIALLNTLIGIIQELKARKTIQKLSLITQTTATVIRQGHQITIPISEIVIDEVMILNNGDQIVTDAKVVEGIISVNEANLTGESEAVVKRENDVVRSGSYVTSGTAYVRVTAVGKDNYIEQLSAKVKALTKPKSVIFGSLRSVLKIIGIIIIPLGVLTFINVYRYSSYDYLPDFLNSGADYHMALKKMAGSMVAMVPSGLFLLTTITFANGVIKLGKHDTLVKELFAIESLARVDIMCLDKTGTITDGTMEVDSIVPLTNRSDEDTAIEENPSGEWRKIIASMNYALKEQNATAIALRNYFGAKRIFRSKATLHFSSDNKYSAVAFDDESYALGAPEMVMKGKYLSIKKDVERYARQGKRVLLFARAGGFDEHKLKGTQTPLALILLNDHVRDNAMDTMQLFHESGVDIKIISGDNHLTVSDVAERAGVPKAKKAVSLAGVPDHKVIQYADEYTVFGRVNPAQKKLLIDTFKQREHTVAMVGDGVNDILALKAADCSVAMAEGSDAARGISHLVLMNNDFSSMPKVVKEGRQIVNNMERASVLYLVKTLYTILLTIVLLMTSNLYPFEPIQMFVIETFIIGIPSFFIALEPSEKRFSGSFLANVFRSVVPGAVLIVMNLLAVYAFARFWPSITTGEISTVGIIAATFAFLLVLLNISMPLNRLRSWVVIGAGVASAFCFIVLGQSLFKLEPITVPSFLLLLLLMETTYIIMSITKRKLISFWA
ncbi:MAG: HAD-IC family P-type ATPase [Candidatus Izemoplasmatales bacterium]|nr:HAD-IC family P-type ATPase [Candidatus Izemoplasmatales bacterium]